VKRCRCPPSPPAQVNPVPSAQKGAADRQVTTVYLAARRYMSRSTSAMAFGLQTSSSRDSHSETGTSCWRAGSRACIHATQLPSSTSASSPPNTFVVLQKRSLGGVARRTVFQPSLRGRGHLPSKTDRQPFNGLFCRTTWISRYQNGKTILDFNEVRDDGVAVASAGPYGKYLYLAPDR